MDKKLHNLIKGDIRKEHFQNGGSLAAWRGVSNVYTDKVKNDNKNKCRKKVQNEE